MRSRTLPLIGAALLLSVAVADTAHGQYTNVALGKTVTGVGTFGVGRPSSGWPNPAPAAFSTLTDGTVPDNGTQWQTGTVWWDRGLVPPNTEDRFGPLADTYVTIDLGNIFSITGFGLSADNNDAYTFYARSSTLDAWAPISSTTTPNPFGMQYFNYQDAFAASPLSARYIAVTAWRGDGYYSLGELEVYTFASVPEPAALGLLGLGLAGLLARRRRQT